MEKDPFKEYLRESEPDKAHKGYAWSTAIGLQAVDGLKPSKYLIDTAIQNIEGKIPRVLLRNSFHENSVFAFSPNEYIAIHRKLFQGIYKHAGKIRDYNITKKNGCLMEQLLCMVVHQN